MHKGFNFSIYLHFIEVLLMLPQKREESPKRIIYSQVGRLFRKFTVSKNVLPIFTN